MRQWPLLLSCCRVGKILVFQVLNVLEEARLVCLDGEELVRIFIFLQVSSVLHLGMHRISSDGLSFQVQRIKKRFHRRNLVAFVLRGASVMQHCLSHGRQWALLHLTAG